MTFVSTHMLFLIWAVPLLLLAYLYGFGKRRRILMRFASAHGLEAIAPDGPGRSVRRWIRAGLVCAALVLLALALSGPRYGYSWKDVERKGIDMIIALDCSRSMLAADIAPTRLDRAKREVYDLLNMLRGDRVGLVAFAGTAFLQCPLTLDYSALHLFLEALSPDFLPVGGSDLPAAITTALSGFDATADSEKAVILITDGESTAGDPLPAAEAAKKAGVKIFTIGVGREGGVPIPDAQGGFKKDAAGQIVVSRLDETSLQRTALATGGAYVRSVAGDMDLDVIYSKEIRGKMAQETLAGTRQQVWENRFQWPLTAAVVLLLIELSIPLSGRRGKPTGVPGLLLACLLAWPHGAAAGTTSDALDAYNQGYYEKALKLYIAGQVNEPDRPEVLYNIGNAYYKLGDFEKAAGHFEAAAESEDTALRQKALYNLGNAAFRQNQLEKAAAHYEAALEIDPEDRQARENLEFVRQIMVRQQPAPGGGQNDRDPENSDTGKEKADGKPAPESPKGENETDDRQEASAAENGMHDDRGPPPAYGNRLDPGETPDPSATDTGQTPESDDRDRVRPSTPDEATAVDAMTARQMLNRLQDKPGKAMIPVYRNRQVEKDW